jgi:hypothetical protein
MASNTTRTMVIANLHAEGWRETARRVYRRVRQSAMQHMVYITPDLDVWVKALRHDSRLPPPDQILATWDQSAEINEIEDELINHLRELSGLATAPRSTT